MSSSLTKQWVWAQVFYLCNHLIELQDQCSQTKMLDKKKLPTLFQESLYPDVDA